MKKITGFTLIELIIYVTVFAIVIVTLTLFVFNFINAYAKIRITKEVSESSQIAMEAMLLEIRHAKNIYIPTSSFNTHPGQLSLETEKDTPVGEETTYVKDTPVGEETTYVDFFLSENNQLCVKKEGQEAEPLTPENVKINSLIFNYLTTDESKSIRIELLANYRQESGKITHQATTTIISSANLRND